MLWSFVRNSGHAYVFYAITLNGILFVCKYMDGSVVSECKG